MRTERQDNLGDAAGGDDGSFLSEFFLDAIQHTVDHRGIAKYDAASHAVYGIFANDTARRIEADARQLGSAGAHAVEGNAKSRQDRAADIASVFVDDRHGCSGSHFDDDDWRFMLCKGTDCVYDHITADGFRVVHQDV